MNTVSLVGRIGSDIKIYEAGEHTKYFFTLAVSKTKKNDSGTYDAYWIPCTAWNKTGEIINQYHSKGSRIAVQGMLNQYLKDEDGQKNNIVSVNVDKFTFIQDKDKSEKTESKKPTNNHQDDEDFPF